MLGRLGMIGFVETSFSNLRPTDYGYIELKFEVELNLHRYALT